MPNLDRTRQFANETAAVATLRLLSTAEVQYMSIYGRFAKSLAELGPPASGAASESGADLIPSDLASTGQKAGFKFSLTGDGRDYQIAAVPLTFGTTGSRTFYSDKDLTIHENRGPQPATANSPQFGQ
jgi:hypothetical protein